MPATANRVNKANKRTRKVEINLVFQSFSHVSRVGRSFLDDTGVGVNRSLPNYISSKGCVVNTFFGDNLPNMQVVIALALSLLVN